MRLLSLLFSPLILCAWNEYVVSATQDGYNEHLDLRPIPGHHLHAEFTFTTSIPRSAYDSHHFRHFPRSLAQILQQTHTAELHLRFALGRWDDEVWGARPRDGRREGGTGVEIWAWIEGADTEEVEQRWGALVNGLSGHFCASLNFIDSTRTTQPLLTFEPEGSHVRNETLHIMHGVLPREVVCTENLTPFLKMLPCKGKAGISSLLDGHKVFDASWQSMSIDVRPVCFDGQGCTIEVEQGISIALSLPRSMRNRHDPIPRPPPIEEIECDQSRSFNAHDTCFPKAFDGQMAWNLTRVFGGPLKGTCEVGMKLASTSDVRLYVTADRQVEVLGRESVEIVEDALHRTYSLGTQHDFDLNLTRQEDMSDDTPPQPPLYISRQLTGYGQQYGGVHTVLRNPHEYAQDVIFFESIPWYLRPFMHTLAVTGGTIQKMYYTPLIDRKQGTHLELLLHIPAESTLVLEYEVEKAILRYTEYPPDANRGFDIGAAVVRVLPNNSSTGHAESQYLRTTSLLLPLPTPDFSMPYNVIILTSTVIALGFGSIFNLLVRRFVLAEEVPSSPLATRLKALIGSIRQRLKARTTDQGTAERKSAGDEQPSTDTGASNDSSHPAATHANGDTKQRKDH